MSAAVLLACAGLGSVLWCAAGACAAGFASDWTAPAEAVASPTVAAGSTAGSFRSPLAFALLADDAPELMLQQRAIERSWGPSDDSVYVVVDLPDWRSEPAALALSAAVPGLGQAYAGDAKRGMWFAAAELTAWMSHVFYRDRGRELREEASRFAGNPTEAGSAWSISRWSDATQADPTEVERLYSADPEVFYDLIASDPRYLAGWSGDPGSTRHTFSDLRRNSGNRLSTARWAATALWVNHAVAAFDALRAARLHNVSLGGKIDLRVNGDWKHGRPALTLALQRRF